MSLNITTIRNLELLNKDKKDCSPRKSIMCINIYALTISPISGGMS